MSDTITHVIPRDGSEPEEGEQADRELASAFPASPMLPGPIQNVGDEGRADGALITSQIHQLSDPNSSHPARRLTRCERGHSARG
jgi:hypothetical protein